MPKLFVEKSIDISAPASKVWEALTKREHTDKWALEFSSGSPQFHIESDWKLGSPVLWKGEDGGVIVEGNVTALEPNKRLRFTVFDVRGERPPVTEEDGITYELKERTVRRRFGSHKVIFPLWLKARNTTACPQKPGIECCRK